MSEEPKRPGRIENLTPYLSDGREPRGGGWVCPACLAMSRYPTTKTIPDLLGGPCATCGTACVPGVTVHERRSLVDEFTLAEIEKARRGHEGILLPPQGDVPAAHVVDLLGDLHPGLEAPTPRIAALKRFNGFPIPFFVDYLPDGTPEFRAMDPKKFVRCIKENLCWVCGQKIEGSDRTFVIGPMCAINRTTAEPASHHECAVWSVRNCPFLRNPDAERREAGVGKGAEELVDPAGMMIRRNPKVLLLWTTRMFRLFKDGNGGVLINIGPPTAWEWWSCGRPALRTEVENSIATGLPILFAQCAGEKDVAELQRRAAEAEKLFPVLTA